MGHFSAESGRPDAGVAELADAPDLGSGVPDVRVRVSSSALSRVFIHSSGSAVVAQLVERHLAKVEVASPSLVYRSNCGCNSMVEFQPSKLATWVRFPSPARRSRLRAAFFHARIPRRDAASQKRMGMFRLREKSGIEEKEKS